MKLFEFGQYVKSVSVQDKYRADWENDDTLLLYNPLSDYASIRISAITVASEDPDNDAPMFKQAIEQSKAKSLPLKIADDKAYFTYRENRDSEDEALIVDFFEVGYKNHYIIISVSTDKNDTELQSLGLAFGDYIASINADSYWVILCDEYGRDPALHFRNSSITIFPLTMLSKRVEDGIDFNVKELLTNLLDQFDSLVKSEKQ